ncbi:MAG: HDOD domain-containing protein [Proteobacteria bacterium]|nr:HDOD domain-containing protein [Pseudomonadota bacterium]
MGKISIENLDIGMVLAGDLTGSGGRLLLPEGTVLDEKHLSQIKAWRVIEVDVKGVTRKDIEARDAARLDPVVLQRAEELVEAFFSLTDHRHEAVAELHRLAVLRTARDLASGVVMHNLRPQMLEEMSPLATSEFRETEVPPLGRLLEGEVELSSMPDIYFRLNEVLNDPLSSVADLAEVVEKDASLAAKLLRLVNSPFYGFMSRIDTILRAISLVGTDELTTLALGISVVHRFKDIPPELVDMPAFWRHSITCGVFAKVLAGYRPGLSVERFFVAGLLHDLGRLILFKKLPRATTEAMIMAQRDLKPLHQAEQEVIGYDHAQAGGRLLLEWKIPPALVDMVRWHHAPDRPLETAESAIIHVADLIAVVFGIGRQTLERVPPLNVSAWSALELSTNVLAPAFTRAEEQIEGIFNIFLDQEV